MNIVIKRIRGVSPLLRVFWIAALGVALGEVFPCHAASSTNSIFFTYTSRSALLADGWSFTAITNVLAQVQGQAVFTGVPQNTENLDTNVGPVIQYARTNSSLGIVTRIPCDSQYLWGSPIAWTNGTFARLSPDPVANLTRNSLFRHLPTNWISARLSVSFAPTANYHQLLFLLYQDDDNYLEEEFTYNSFLTGAPFNLAGPTAITMDQEFYTFPARMNWTYCSATNVILRIDRDPPTDDISTYWSQDGGTNWVFVGRLSQSLTNTQLGIVTGGSATTFPLTNLPNCDLSRLDIITSDTYSPPLPQLVLQPQHLVFNSVQGQSCTATQRVNIMLRRAAAPASWSVTSNSVWLSSDVSAGQTPNDASYGFAANGAWTNANVLPVSCNISVNTAGLTAGIYQGTLTYAVAGVSNSPATVSVTLIVNPNAPVSVSTWKDTKVGALSVIVDDSAPWGFDDLVSNGVAGTFVMWHVSAPAFYTTYYQAGMELGSHTIDHPAFLINEPALRHEFESNIVDLVSTTPVPQSQVISFAWPVGVNSPNEEVIAADYYLAARGYNINQLEDATPNDFMNLKCYNSHEHFPFPPSDFKTVVDSAITQNKWFNLVLHNSDNSDGAIGYAVSSNVWVAPLGTVTKYIRQRDRTVITNFVQTTNFIQFDCRRLPLDASSWRSFETAIGTNDTLTVRANVSSSQVTSLLVNGVSTPFTGNSSVTYFDTLITTNTKTILLSFQPNVPPVLPSLVSTQTISELTALLVTNTATDANVPAQTMTYTLLVTNVADGSVQNNVVIDTNGVISWIPTETQGPGTYRITTVVTDNGVPQMSATNSFTVVVNEVNTAPVLPFQPSRFLLGQQSLAVTNTASDSDIPVNPLSYRLTVAPLPATIDTNGIIRWTPTSLQVPGTYTFTTVVTDTNILAVNAHNLSATNTFTVQVLTNGLILPAQTNQTINELTTLLLTNAAVDVNSNSLVGGIVTNTFLFNYPNRTALLADGWSFLATTSGSTRDTEVTNPAVGVPMYAQTNGSLGTVLRLPCDTGDVFLGLNNTENSLFHSLPTNWVSMRVSLSFAPTQNYQQAQLTLYQDDDNYIDIGRAYNIYASGQSLEFTEEFNQVPTALSTANETATVLTLRLDRDIPSGNISGLYSTDGTTWQFAGTTSQSLTNTQIAIWTGASVVPYATTLLGCDLARVDILTTNTTVNLTYTLTVSNSLDGSTVTNATIDVNGVIAWTPTETQGPGTYVFTTTVSDGSSATINTFTVTVNEVNTAPTLPAQTNRTIVGIQSLTVTNTATDVDVPVNPLGYRLASAPAGATIGTNGIISWTPTAGQVPGVYPFTTVVTDTNINAVNAQNLTATNTFTVTVQGTQSGPSLPAQTNRTNDELTLLTVTNTALDTDIPPLPLTYTLFVTNLLNNGAVLNATISTNGIITWIPTEAQGPSLYLFTTVVTDGTFNATNSFTVIVYEVNTAPVLTLPPNTNILEQVAWSAPATAIDSDLPVNPLTFALVSGPSGLTVATNGVINWTPSELQGPGVYVVTVSVTDTNASAVNATSLSTTNSFQITVNEVNTAPVLTLPPNTNILEQVAWSATATAIDSDLPVNPLTFALVSGPTGLTVATNGVINWTPSELQGPGVYVVTVSVTDTNASAVNATSLSTTNSFQITVNEVNTAPVLTLPPNTNILEQVAWSATATAIDSDLPVNPLTFALVSGPSGLTVATNGVINWTPSELQGPGVYVVTVSVTDTNASAVNATSLSTTNSFQITVNEVNTAPVLTLPPNTNILEQVAWSATATAIDSDLPVNPLTFALVSGPSGLTVATNGVINWTPSELQGPGVYVVTVSVTDTNASAVNATSLSTTNSFQITVNEVNTAPVLTLPPDTNILEQVAWSATATAIDSDLPVNPLTFALVSGPSGLTVATNGVINWTPSELQGPGVYVVTVSVTDTNASAVNATSLSTTNSFQITVSEVNTAPVLTLPPNTNILEQVAWSATATAIDSDLPVNPLTFALVSGPTGLTVATNGVINWTPSELQGPGVYVVTVSVTDTNASAVNATSLSTTNSFQITVSEVNTAPVLTLPPNTNILEQVAWSATATAIDSDLPVNPLTFALVSGPTGLTVATNGVINWTPSELQGPGVYVVTVSVTDTNASAVNATSLSTTNSFQITVSEVNTAPVLTLPPDTNILEQVAWSATATAIDSDLPVNPLTFALVSGPTGLTVATNGVINWTPSELQGPGVYVVTVSVTDTNASAVNATSLSTTNSFQITVNEVNTAPVLTLPPNTNILEQVAWSATATAIDSDLPVNPLTFALVSGPTGLTVATNGVINWTPSELQGPGVYVVTVSVTDTNASAVNATSLSTTNSFQITVSEVNTAPVLTLPPNTNILEQVAWSATATAIDSDLPVNPLTFALVSGPTGLTVATNGVINWTPSELQGPGVYVVTVSVTDTNASAVNATSLSTTNSFQITVSEVNTAPVLTLPPDTNILEQVAWSATATAIDSDLPVNPLTFALVSGPSGLTVATNGVINWTPSELQGPGVYVVTVSVTDTNASAVNATSLSTTNSFQITVNEVNTAPVLTLPPNTNILEQVAWSAPATAIDSDLPVNPLTFALVSGPTGLTVATNGVINWTPSELQGPGVYTVTVSVTDTNASAVNATSLSTTNSFQITVSEVNTAPVLTLPPDTNILEQVAWSATATAIDSDLPVNPLTFALVSGPSGLTVATNGVINWTPSELQGPGVYVVTVSVTDTNASAVNATSLSTTNSFQITVSEVNTAPVLTLPPNTNILEQVAWSATATAIDSDLPVNPLTFALVSGPSGLTVATNGVINWTPSELQGPGVYVVTVSVTDTNASAVNATSLSTTNSFQITVSEVNTAPVLTLPPNTNILEQVAWSATATAIDSDLPVNPLTFALVSGPSGLTVATNGVINWTPSELQGPGVYVVTVSVTDTNASAVNATSLSTTNSFQITVSEVNTAPVLGAVGSQVVNELATLIVTNTATDSDLPTNILIYTLAVTNLANNSVVTNVVIDGNGVITWTPTEAQGPSTNIITTVVRDNGTPARSATNSFIVVVNEVNTAPVLPGQSIRTIATLATLTVTNTATDSDLPTNTLSYTLLAPPTGATIDTNGVITWTPTEAQGPSTNTITTVVTDNNPWAVNAQHLSATNSFTVIVTAPNPVFKITSMVISNGEAVVTWNSVNGNYYRLQYKDNLSDTNWTDVAPDILATGPVTSATNVLGAVPRRFYRVELVTYQSLAQPVIQFLATTNNTVKITSTSMAGHVYRLQFKNNMTDTEWIDLLPDVAATGATTTITNFVGTVPQRFYRISLRK